MTASCWQNFCNSAIRCAALCRGYCALAVWLKKIRRIPVVKDGKLVGSVNIGDVHRALFQEHLPG